MSFDIGQTDGLSIFTNADGNDDNIFNINTDIGPSFTLDQGREGGIAEVGLSGSGIINDVIIDMPNESPIDFVNEEPPKLQRTDSNISDVTIEADTLRTHSNNSHQTHKHSHSASNSHNASNSHKHTNKHKDLIPNMGFDDLLDSKKLKPIDNLDTTSIGGESHSTIRQPESEPNSPMSFKPVMSMPTPPSSPFPSTFQNDRADRADRDRRGRNVPSSNSEQEQTQSQPSPDPEIPRYLNEDDEKMDLLLKLKSLEERGKIVLSKHYNIKSNLDEIRLEYRNQTANLERQASVNFMRKGLVFCTSALEYGNRKFDPFGAKLDGWGESIMENIMDYDGIFERLHEKYKGYGQMEPEMELFLALAGSAFQFHLSQTFFKSAIPQLGQVLRENPSVIQGFMNVAQEAARRAGPTASQSVQNTQSVPMPANDFNVGVGGIGGIGGIGPGQMQSPGINFNSLLGQVGITSGVLSDFAKTMGNPPPPPQSAREFKDPPVTDLYRQMVQAQKEDSLSVSSDRSVEDSPGRAKAIISPLPSSKRGGGGNVIKLM